MTRQMIMDNVYLTYVPSEKFKTSFLSAQMVMPLKKDTAGLNALLVNVLNRGTLRCPDMTALSRQLDLLYGARSPPSARRGRTSCSALWPAVWTTACFQAGRGSSNLWRI